MSEPSQTPAFSRAIQRLTIAVWVAALAMIANAGVTLYGAFAPPRESDEVSLDAPAYPESSVVDEFANFHEWPIEMQIEAASVIVVTRHEKVGDETRSVIAEILKQTPDAKFYYKVGDVFEYHTPFSSGEGSVIFYTGSPASMRYGVSYEDERFGRQQISFSMLRELIEAQD